MAYLIVGIFITGYLAIAFEHSIKVNKAGSALVTGVLCWTVYILSTPGKQSISEHLSIELGSLSQILFFLMGAMTIVELIDAHDGFELITKKITTRNKKKLIWIIGFLSFFLSAVLDNLTTTIVMISLVRKLVGERNDRLQFAGLIIIAANAGGAWSPIGDVTTTMLWIGGQITALNIMMKLILPSLACFIVPAFIMQFSMKGDTSRPVGEFTDENREVSQRHRMIVLFTGIGILLFVPVFKTLTHLPPFMGMMMGLGILWITVELLHHGKDEDDRKSYTVAYALRKIDTPSILFFLGILLAIAALQATGQLTHLANKMSSAFGNINLVVIAIGLASSVVDNVPLVAACTGMYPLALYPTDHYFWEFLAYATGTGGSALIIGSAAGVAAMGIEKINFIWYLKKISWMAIAGFFAGALVYIMCR